MATVVVQIVSNNVGAIFHVYPRYSAQKRALTFTSAAAKTRFLGKLNRGPGGRGLGLGKEATGRGLLRRD